MDAATGHAACLRIACNAARHSDETTGAGDATWAGPRRGASPFAAPGSRAGRCCTTLVSLPAPRATLIAHRRLPDDRLAPAVTPAIATCMRGASRLYRLLPRSLRHALRIGWEAAKLWVSEDGTELGSSIAFYSMFALAPLLVVAIALAGEVFGEEAARGQIVAQISGLVGHQAALAIEQMVRGAWHSHSSGTAAAIGIGVLLVGASGVFVELRKAFNRIGRIDSRHTSLSTFVRVRLVAFALMLGFGFLMVASLLLSAALSALTQWLSQQLPVLAHLLTLFDFVLSLLVLAVAFVAFLRWLPDRAPRWRSITAGAVVSALLFAVGKQLIGLYLGRVSTASSFGAAGSLVVVLLWVYYSAQILLFGTAVAWSLDGVRAAMPDETTPPAPAHG
jgi:membrane protein